MITLLNILKTISSIILIMTLSSCNRTVWEDSQYVDDHIVVNPVTHLVIEQPSRNTGGKIYLENPDIYYKPVLYIGAMQNYADYFVDVHLDIYYQSNISKRLTGIIEDVFKSENNASPLCDTWPMSWETYCYYGLSNFYPFDEKQIPGVLFKDSTSVKFTLEIRRSSGDLWYILESTAQMHEIDENILEFNDRTKFEKV